MIVYDDTRISFRNVWKYNTRKRIHLPSSVLRCRSAYSLYYYGWQMFLHVSINSGGLEYKEVPENYRNRFANPVMKENKRGG